MPRDTNSRAMWTVYRGQQYNITLCYAYTAPLELMKVPNLNAVNRSAEIQKADQVKELDFIKCLLSLYTTKTIQ